MNTYLSKPHPLFWATAVIFMFLSAYYQRFDDALDINVHDTYYVIHNSHVAFLLAIFYALFGLFYWILSKSTLELNRILTRIHTFSTLLIIPLYFIGYYIIEIFYKSEFPLFDDTSILQIFITILVLVGLVSQIFFVLNIVISSYKYFIHQN